DCTQQSVVQATPSADSCPRSLHDALPIYRSVARGDLGGSTRPCCEGVPPPPAPVWPRGDRRHHLLALHERGNLSRPEARPAGLRSEEHTSELQSRENLVCRLLLEKKKPDQ